MNKLLSLILLIPGLSGSLHADSSFAVADLSVTIPDGDLNGYQSSQVLSGLTGAVNHVAVNLNISGGFNGDLYAYLWHGNTLAVLINRVGRSSSSTAGYANTGFGPDSTLNQFTLDDQAGHDVHLYRNFPYVLNATGQLTGIWQPDGRLIDPLSAGSAFETAGQSNPLGVFNGMDPNGLWFLYVADVAPGFESTLLGWGMQIEVVPEPGSLDFLALALSCVLLVLKSQGQTKAMFTALWCKPGA